MKSQRDIEERLQEILGNDLCFDKNGDRVKPATVGENAPLALIQVSAESKVEILRWILRDVS